MLNSSMLRQFVRRRSKRQTTERPFVFNIPKLGKRKAVDESPVLKHSEKHSTKTIPENLSSIAVAKELSSSKDNFNTGILLLDSRISGKNESNSSKILEKSINAPSPSKHQISDQAGSSEDVIEKPSIINPQIGMLNSSKMRLLARRRSKRKITERPFVFNIPSSGKSKTAVESPISKHTEKQPLLTIPEEPVQGAKINSFFKASSNVKNKSSLTNHSKRNLLDYFEDISLKKPFSPSVRHLTDESTGAHQKTLVKNNLSEKTVNVFEVTTAQAQITGIDGKLTPGERNKSTDTAVSTRKQNHGKVSSRVDTTKEKSAVEPHARFFKILDSTHIANSSIVNFSKPRAEEISNYSSESDAPDGVRNSQNLSFHLHVKKNLLHVPSKALKKNPKTKKVGPKNKPKRKNIGNTQRRKKGKASTDLEIILEIIEDEVEDMIESSSCNEREEALLQNLYSEMETEFDKKLQLLKKYKENKRKISQLSSENKNLANSRYQIREELLRAKHQEIEDRALATDNKNHNLIQDFLKTF